MVLAACVACQGKKTDQAPPKLFVHGVVGDAVTNAFVPGVTVTLQSIDGLPSTTTDANGYYKFPNLTQFEEFILQYQKTGYSAVTVSVKRNYLAPTTGGTTTTTGTGDTTTTTTPLFNFTCGVSLGNGSCEVVYDPAKPDACVMNVKMNQANTLSVGGWVYTGTTRANGAAVRIVTSDPSASLVAQATTDSFGHFLFSNVAAGSYNVQVLPFDENADGVTDFQFTQLPIIVTAAGGVNLTNLIISLTQVQKTLVASNIILQIPAGGLTGANLQAGVAGVLEQTDGFFLHFGAEVEDGTQYPDRKPQFELVQTDRVTSPPAGSSAPIAITTDWTPFVSTVASGGAKNIEVVIKPATGTFVPFEAGERGYELRIKTLYFRDGTPLIATGSPPGKIDFTVQAHPPTILSPSGVALYLAAQPSAGPSARVADGFVTDSNSVRLVMQSTNDFVRAFDATSGLDLQWTDVAGAKSYKIYARNTTTSALNQQDGLQWSLTDVVAASDPTLSTTVIARGVLKSVWGSPKFGFTGIPFLFGNEIDIAVTTVDAFGFESAIDETLKLPLRDRFGPLLGGVAFPAALPAPFAATTELGDTFHKIVRFDLSEAVDPTSSAGIVVQTVHETSFGATPLVKNLTTTQEALGLGNGVSPDPTLSTPTSAFARLKLSARGACTEVTAGRSTGDTTVFVRDASHLTTGTFLFVTNAGIPAFLAEASGTVDLVNQAINLAAPLAAGTSIPAQSVVCGLTGAAAAPAVASPVRFALNPASIGLYAGAGAPSYPFTLSLQGYPVGGIIKWALTDNLGNPATGATSGCLGVAAPCATTATGATVTYLPPAAVPPGGTVFLTAWIDGIRKTATIGLTIPPAFAISPSAITLDRDIPATSVTFTTVPTAVTATWATVPASVIAAGATATVAVPGAGTLSVTANNGINSNTVVIAAPLAATNPTQFVVSDASLFRVGQQVMIDDPGTIPAGSSFESAATVAGFDTRQKVVLLNGVTRSHGAGAAIIPTDGIGSTYALRPSISAGANLSKDALVQAGQSLAFGAAVAVQQNDSVLIDVDGDKDTTATAAGQDQFRVKVTDVTMFPQASPAQPTFTVVLGDGAPASNGPQLQHGRVVPPIVRFLGDAFYVSGMKDTSGNAGPDLRGNLVTVDGAVF